LSGRLFTFGCSFTEYYWPTWADILGREFEYYENWGRLGAGNQYIFNSLSECHLQHHLTKNDTVIIMWSSPDREDRYINNMWQTPGPLALETFYDKNFVSKYYDQRGYLIRDLTSINAAKDLLDFWGVKYELLSMIPFNNNLLYQIDNDLLQLFKSVIQTIKISAYEILYNQNWNSKKFQVDDRWYLNFLENKFNQCAGADWPSFSNFLANNIEGKFRDEMEDFGLFQFKDFSFESDFHPTPIEHLIYLNTVLPEFKINLETENWINNYKLLDDFNKHQPTNRL
jgi:hypothetical protein